MATITSKIIRRRVSGFMKADNLAQDVEKSQMACPFNIPLRKNAMDGLRVILKPVR